MTNGAETKEVTIVAGEGRFITEYGSRVSGESFWLPLELADAVAAQQPGAFEVVVVEQVENEEEA